MWERKGREVVVEEKGGTERREGGRHSLTSTHSIFLPAHFPPHSLKPSQQTRPHPLKMADVDTKLAMSLDDLIAEKKAAAPRGASPARAAATRGATNDRGGE